MIYKDGYFIIKTNLGNILEKMHNNNVLNPMDLEYDTKSIGDEYTIITRKSFDFFEINSKYIDNGHSITYYRMRDCIVNKKTNSLSYGNIYYEYTMDNKPQLFLTTDNVISFLKKEYKEDGTFFRNIECNLYIDRKRNENWKSIVQLFDNDLEEFYDL